MKLTEKMSLLRMLRLKLPRKLKRIEFHFLDKSEQQELIEEMAHSLSTSRDGFVTIIIAK